MSMTRTTSPSTAQTCPTCGNPDATFSKTQMRKKKSVRKCRNCVELKEVNNKVTECEPISEKDDTEYVKMGEHSGETLDASPMDRNGQGSSSPTRHELHPRDSKDDSLNNIDWSPMIHAGEESSCDKIRKHRHNYMSNKRLKQNDLFYSDETVEDHHDIDVSVEQLKKEILGRSIPSIYDVHAEREFFPDKEISRLVQDPSVFADGRTVAEYLHQDLSCPVCHERFYNPVSLLCGHSFCYKCLSWWLNQCSAERKNVEDNNRIGTCPSCRNPILYMQGKNSFHVNTALKACMDALYGSEMKQRRLADHLEEQKSTSGEQGGIHHRGYEELLALPDEDEIAWGQNKRRDEENGWLFLYALSEPPSQQVRLSIRRNIVLCDSDQRFRMSLGFTKVNYTEIKNNGVIDVELCLLRMEEDELDDSGFPTIVTEGSDDEALICAGNEFAHTFIEASVRIVSTPTFKNDESTSINGSKSNEKPIKEVPVSRGLLGKSGSVRFRIDEEKLLSNKLMEDAENSQIIKIRFCHMATKTILELRLPSKSEKLPQEAYNHEYEYEFDAKVKKKSKNSISRFFLDDDDCDDLEEDDGPNEYERDGFVVQSHESDEADSDDERGLSDRCFICRDGGVLIVCDGGNNDGGCGNCYHIECINRSVVPPGDWICNLCAKKLGINVGIEGHEYTTHDITSLQDEELEESLSLNERQTVDDSSAEDSAGIYTSRKTQIKTKRRIIYTDDNDSF